MALYERRRRLLRIARERGDRLAVATLEGHKHFWRWTSDRIGTWASCKCGIRQLMDVTESEMRALWGDR